MPSEHTTSLICMHAGSKLPAPGEGVTAAINTAKLSNTNQCGQCVEVKCVNGKTRGLPSSEYPEIGCKNATSIFVTITDSTADVLELAESV